MTRISVVGVEGSGKTVLMAALGDRCQYPNDNGLSLRPKDQDTADFVMSNMSVMRGGAWPQASSAEIVRRLGWVLQWRPTCSCDSIPIGELRLLDYGGEVLRMAFGRRANPSEPGNASVDELRQHVSHSDALVILVNLTSVLDGDLSNARSSETVWLAQRLAEFAQENGCDRVAICLSQMDRYNDLAKEHGGAQGLLPRILPYFTSTYAVTTVLPIAAVDATVPGTKGRPVPAADFSSRGLDGLLNWMADFPERTFRDGHQHSGRSELACDAREIRALCKAYRVMLAESAQMHASSGNPVLAELFRQLQCAIGKIAGGCGATPDCCALETLFVWIGHRRAEYIPPLGGNPFFIEHRRQQIALMRGSWRDAVTDALFQSVT